MYVEQYKDVIDACRFCHMCRHVCTAATLTKKETLTPRGKALILKRIYGQEENYDEEVVEAIYQCAECGLCKTWCISHYDVPELISAARADIVSQGKAPSIVYDLDKNVQETHNLYGKSANEKTENFESQMNRKTKPEILFFIGCLCSYEQREIPQAFTKILSVANIPYLILEDECCGALPHELGLRDRAHECAKRVSSEIENSHVKEVVVSCSHCYEAFTQKYPKWGMRIPARTRHVSEYLLELIKKGKLNLSKKVPKRVVYHDSSKLARFSNIFDVPRDLISAIRGIEFKEMRRNRAEAYCCGGGALELTNPKLATEAAKLLVKEMSKEHVDIILTADPHCRQKLQATCQALKIPLEVLDIVELVAKAVE